MSPEPSGMVNVERVMNDQATDDVERLFTAAVGVIKRLADGCPWPLGERADGYRYWSHADPVRPVWEPLSEHERAVIEWIEAQP